MSREDHERELRTLTAAAASPVNGQRAVLDSRIRAFELRYEMSSDALLDGLAAKDVRETAEIAEWLFLLEARARVAG